MSHFAPFLVGCIAVAFVATGTAAPSGAEVLEARGLKLEVPAGWRSEAPGSSMRVAQLAVPGEAGEGQLTVFHFGAGGGGGVDANIDRWLSQLVVAPGVEPQRETFEAPSRRGDPPGDPPFTIHFVDAAGTVTASRVGSFPSEDQPGWRLFGAVVEGEGGPWYLRLVGPDATLAAQRDAFLAMLRGVSR